MRKTHANPDNSRQYSFFEVGATLSLLSRSKALTRSNELYVIRQNQENREYLKSSVDRLLCFLGRQPNDDDGACAKGALQFYLPTLCFDDFLYKG